MSLSARLTTGLTVVLALFVGLAIAVVVRQRAQLIGQLDDQLAAIAPLERPARGPAPGPAAPEAPAQDPTDRNPISNVYIAAVGMDGTVDVLVRGQLLDDVVDTASFVADPPSERTLSTAESADGATSFRVLAEPTPTGSETIVIALPTSDVDQTIRQLITTFAAVAVAIAATLGAVAWWVTRLGVRPLTEMTRTAEAIAGGDRSQRAPELSDTTEAGQLARALNTMLDQRDDAEDRLRQFVSDASHELRTPLTSMRGFLELYAQGGFREHGQMDDAVRRMTDEADRMAGLVENLLQLARMDEELPLDRTMTDVGELVRDVCADAGTARPGLAISAEAPDRGDLMVNVDRQRVRQMLAGLVDNAAVHAVDASIRVGASRSGEYLALTVSDDGPGMAADDAERVFDRFYRGDQSRSRRSGGSGLGLAIAKMVAERHGGEIALATSPGEGCDFQIRLPIEVEEDQQLISRAWS